MRMPTSFPVRAGVMALGAGVVGAGVLKIVPRLVSEVFIGGAARVAGLLSGAATVRMDDGAALMIAGQPVLVTAACSATDFFLMTTAVLGWHFARGAERRAWRPVAIAGAVVAAVPLTLFVNALRIVAVAHAHRWIIPRMPDAYGSFLHMLTGAAVFLPALIVMNLLLEYYGNARNSSVRA